MDCPTYFGHPGQAKTRRIREMLGTGWKYAIDGDIGGPVVFSLPRLMCVEDRHPDDAVGIDQFPDLCRRHVILADMDPVGTY